MYGIDDAMTVMNGTFASSGGLSMCCSGRVKPRLAIDLSLILSTVAFTWKRTPDSLTAKLTARTS